MSTSSVRAGPAIATTIVFALLTIGSHATNDGASSGSFKQATLVQGESYKLECPAENLASYLLIDWFYNDERINGQFDRYTVTDKGVLHIDNMQVYDSGNFTCSWLNGFASAFFTINVLVVAGDPSVASEPPIPQSSHPDGPMFYDTRNMRPAFVEQFVGKSVDFHCQASGEPTPDITWLRNDQPLVARSNSGRKQQPVKITYRGLRLNDLALSDSGRYTCRARNIHGEIEFTYTLNVRTNVKLVPSFTNESSATLLVPLGDSITLRCDTRSEATPAISWLKRRFRSNTTTNVADGSILLPEGFAPASELPSGFADLNNDAFVYKRILGDGPRYDIPTKVYQSRLTIESATVSDAGIYICLASNEHGTNALVMHLRVFDENGVMVADDPTPVVVTVVPRTRPPNVQRPVEENADANAGASDGGIGNGNSNGNLASGDQWSRKPTQPTVRPALASGELHVPPTIVVSAPAEFNDQPNVMLSIYILAPLLIIIVSLVLVVYYVHTRERTKRKRLRAAASVQHHAGSGSGAKSASNSSASLPSRNAGAGVPGGNVMQLAAMNGSKGSKREYVALGGAQQPLLSPRSTAYPVTPHAVQMWSGGVQPTLVNPAAVVEAQTMLPLCLPQYEYNGNHAAQFEYFQNANAVGPNPNMACKPTSVHQYANANGCAPVQFEYPMAPIAANGYALAPPMYATNMNMNMNMNTLSTQQSTAYNTHNSHNAQSSTSASYTSIRVSPT